MKIINGCKHQVILGSLVLFSALFGPETVMSATLASISVTPANPTINIGQTQKFTATGTFSDASTQVLGTASIAAGGSHTCALLADGTVQCWGNNYAGQLGDGTNTVSSTPVSVIGISTATAISAGLDHTCALLTDGTLNCWGNNFVGELGNGTFGGYSFSPVSVSGISSATAVSAGFDHTCALLTDGTVQCWGSNSFGQLGNGTIGGYSTTPASVSGISSATAVSAGTNYTCALLTDGTVQCWGFNYTGQLGDGTTTDSSTPVSVSGISTATAISAGVTHTCALLADGTVQCWGWNGVGTLGNGTSTGPEICNGASCSTTPVSVSGISTATAVSAGNDHTCVLLANGAVSCWGFNAFGQLGNGARNLYS